MPGVDEVLVLADGAEALAVEGEALMGEVGIVGF